MNPRTSILVLPLLLLGCLSPLHLEYSPGQVESAVGRGMVVAEDRAAAEVGARVLAEGGNAVDAAVAVAFALGATYPQAGSPGGGGFAIISLPGEEPAALDFREVAPASATEDMFVDAAGKVDRKRSLWSASASGVPGMTAGLFEMHQRYGRLPWTRLVQPAVEYAEGGYAMPAGLADALNTHRERLSRHAGAREIFTRDDRPWREGDVLVQADLARTLTAIRDRGTAGFYHGEVAAALTREMVEGGGLVTAMDLAAYRPTWREPARFGFRGREVITMPLPSSAGVVLRAVFGVLEATGGGAPGSVDRLHLFAEAERRAFADRNAFLGDPANVPPERLATLSSERYVAGRAESVDRDRATPSARIEPGAARLLPESNETTNLCVLDREGGAAVLTITSNATFGSGVVARGTGVILNNQMDDFAAKPGEPNLFGLRQGVANRIVAGNRMLSSMSPTVVIEDGRAILLLGAAGGPRILSAVAWVVLGNVGDGAPLYLAVLAPRIHHQHLPDVVFYEDADVVWPEGHADPTLLLTGGKIGALETMGHEMRVREDGIGRLTAIAADPVTGEATGAADPRSYGAAVRER